jgi:hypothetical protein
MMVFFVFAAMVTLMLNEFIILKQIAVPCGAEIV